MNRPNKYNEVFITKARNCMKTYDFIKCLLTDYKELYNYSEKLRGALDKACEELYSFSKKLHAKDDRIFILDEKQWERKLMGHEEDVVDD